MKDILFLQLPLLDNDAGSSIENTPLAAQYLAFSALKAGEGRYYNILMPDSAFNHIDNRALASHIIRVRPYAVAATLYLWNIERTINILRQIRRHLPDTVFLAGGPEVARSHPFLFRSGVVDIAVCGEGEPVFPEILKSLRHGETTNFQNVAWRSRRGYKWGSDLPPEPPLQTILPPPSHPLNQPDSNGIAYMETVRGCPFRCAFCRYGQQRRKVSRLSTENIIARIKILAKRGAKEIRFIDPTFNARPGFHELLAAIASVNRNHAVKFFAELQGGSITADTAGLLARANITQVEVGVQSTDYSVLKAVGRDPHAERVLQGIDLLSSQGISTTLDVMCGLPEQKPSDVRTTLTRLAAVPNSHVQLLHTLLIPGSPLRSDRRKLGLRSQHLPPYRVTSTPAMSATDITEMDQFASILLGARLDSPAERFVSYRLPDLFQEQIKVNLCSNLSGPVIGGSANRRALIFKNNDLFTYSSPILSIIERAIKNEPDILWQFVLSPSREEPLDLIDRMISTIDIAPEHFLDRMHAVQRGHRRSARRIFVRLQQGRKYDPDWKAEAEHLLSSNFY